MTTARACNVCNDSTLCTSRGLAQTYNTTGDFNHPIVAKVDCAVAADKASAFLYTMVLRLAAKVGVTVEELMTQHE